jgi:hypothetical protein
VLGENSGDRLTPKISGSPGPDTVNKRNSLPLVKRRLRCGVSRNEKANQEYAKGAGEQIQPRFATASVLFHHNKLLI